MGETGLLPEADAVGVVSPAGQRFVHVSQHLLPPFFFSEVVLLKITKTSDSAHNDVPLLLLFPEKFRERFPLVYAKVP